MPTGNKQINPSRNLRNLRTFQKLSDCNLCSVRLGPFSEDTIYPIDIRLLQQISK